MCLFTCLFTFPHGFEHGKHIITTLCIYFYSVITLGCIHSMNRKIKIKNASRSNPGSAANCLRCIETTPDRSQTTCPLILFHTGIKAIKVQHKCHRKGRQIFLLQKFCFLFYSYNSIIIVEIYFVFSSLFLRIFL